MSAEADTEAGGRSVDSSVNSRRNTVTRGADHAFTEGHCNGRRFTSIGQDGNGAAGARVKTGSESRPFLLSLCPTFLLCLADPLTGRR
jgi:hypothetical protein